MCAVSRTLSLIAGPRDACAFSVVELPSASVGNPLLLLNEVTNLREVGGEVLVDFEFGLDQVEKTERTEETDRLVRGLQPGMSPP